MIKVNTLFHSLYGLRKHRLSFAYYSVNGLFLALQFLIVLLYLVINAIHIYYPKGLKTFEKFYTYIYTHNAKLITYYKTPCIAVVKQ